MKTLDEIRGIIESKDEDHDIDRQIEDHETHMYLQKMSNNRYYISGQHDRDARHLRALQARKKSRQKVTEETLSENSAQFPPVLVLKRKALRVYPDGQIVALYYSDKLQKHISIPYSSIGISEEIFNG